ncbi:MAG: hypothetical protein A2V85_01305 [Chloroflexi bacterium RBG_16_72_14]|nr:MAG: hypothetical protein A2V85_01305 [Chloroflexi bacterium RBG_16_72_14]
MTLVYTATVVPRDSAGSWSSLSSTTTRWSGVSSGSRSTSGVPMLPPRTAGWSGSAARIAWASEAVVVLPLVPVTPTVGAGQRRRNRSDSPTRAGTSGSPAARASTRARSWLRRRGSVVGESGVIEGEVVTRAASRQVPAGSTSGPRRSVTSQSPSCPIAASSSPAGRPS